VEKHEKLAQRSGSHVHEHRLAFKVGKPPLQILLRKTLYSLFESDRGLLDLQFSYSNFCQLLFKIFEVIELKQGAGNTFGQGPRRGFLQFSYSIFCQLLFKILEIIELKQGADNTFGQGRRRATASCAPCAASSHPRVGYPRRPRPLAARCSPPPEADRIPRLRTCRGRPRPTTRRGLCHATRRHTASAVPAGHAPPPRTGGTSASSRPCAPYYGRVSRRHQPRPASPLSKRRHFPLCAPTEPPPSIAAATGELAAPLAAAAGRPSHSIP
jgi:hypothetical protein